MDNPLGGTYSMHKGGEEICNKLVGTEGDKKWLGRPANIWQNNIEVDIDETGFSVVDWIYFAQYRDQW